MKLPLKIVSIVLLILCFRGVSYSQVFWPSAMDYKLRGNVKIWIMKYGDGSIIREMKFNTPEEFHRFQNEMEPLRCSPDYYPKKRKSEYEKKYDRSMVDSTNRMVFNAQMQLLEKQNDSIHESNQFSADGQILVHITTQTFSKLIVEPATRRYEESSYIYSYTKSFVILFKYNESGHLIQYEYYDSDPVKNQKIVFKYDHCDNLIESNKFNKTTIQEGYLKEYYMDKFILTKIDSSFSIDEFYPDYWSKGHPVIENLWYNDFDQKIQFTSFNGYAQTPGFKAKWHYDANGLLLDEVHYDIQHDTENCRIVFDNFGNVISEENYDYLSKSEQIFHFEILYE